MKSLVILLLALSASSAFADAEITPYNVTIKIQDAAGHRLSGANRGVFLVGDFRQGTNADIERRFKAQTDATGKANIPVNKNDYYSLQFNRLELFCLNLDDAFYCSNGADDRDVLTPLNPYPGTGQSKVKYACAYSMKNPLNSSSSPGEVAVACKTLN